MARYLGSSLICFVFAASPSAADDFDQLKSLYNFDSSQPLEVHQSLLYERNGVNVYDLNYASPKGGRVTAYLVAPADTQPHAGIVFGHWGSGTRTEFLPEATLYARAGAVSLLVDNPWVRPAPWRKPLKQLENPDSDRDAFIQAVVDLRRGIDLLLTRPDVDAKKLAYVGHSFGAQWGAILSAVDGRLQTCVLMGGVPDAESIWRDGPDAGLVEYRANAPKDKQEAYLKAVSPTSAIHYVPHSKVPLLFQFARYEQYFDQAAMTRYYEAASQPKEVKWYDAGHDLNDLSALSHRIKWLRGKVGLGPVESFLQATIEAK